MIRQSRHPRLCINQCWLPVQLQPGCWCWQLERRLSPNYSDPGSFFLNPILNYYFCLEYLGLGTKFPVLWLCHWGIWRYYILKLPVFSGCLIWLLSNVSRDIVHTYFTSRLLKVWIVTDERLGVYRPEEHIDNPKDYADNKDARQYDPRLRGLVQPIELEIDPQTGMVSLFSYWFATSYPKIGETGCFSSRPTSLSFVV